MDAVQRIPTDSVPMHGTLSSQEIVMRLNSLDREQSVKIRMKCGDLTSAWKNATAVKRDGFFECIIDEDPSEPGALPFDDERTSLLSVDLWEIGWYSLDPSEEANFRAPSIEYAFEGEKTYDILYEGQLYTLYPSCTMTVASVVSTFHPRAKVLCDKDSGFLYFMAAKTKESDLPHKAVVYNCAKSCPEFVSLEQLTLETEPDTLPHDLDFKTITLSVKSFVRTHSVAGLLTQASDKNDIEKTSQPSDNATEHNQGHLTSLARQKSQRTGKTVQPYSPEELIIRRRSRLPSAERQKAPKKKSTKQKDVKLNVQPPPNQKNTARPPAKKRAPQIDSDLETENQELRKRLQMMEQQLADLKDSLKVQAVQQQPQPPPLNLPMFASIGGQLPHEKGSNQSQDSEAIKAMKLMLATQHMTQMASLFSHF